jgi:hypothetical protein
MTINTAWKIHKKIIATVKEAVPWFRQLIVGLSPRRPGFDATPCWICSGQCEPPTGFSSEYFIFSFSVSFNQLSTLINYRRYIILATDSVTKQQILKNNITCKLEMSAKRNISGTFTLILSLDFTIMIIQEKR